MLQTVFAIHPGLDRWGRLPALVRPSRVGLAAEFAVLVVLGLAAAALSSLGKLGLGIPGHSILRVMFPMALGLALVPRQGAATVMSLGGAIGAGLLPGLGATGLGAGALTSLMLTGVLVDAALLHARDGKALYGRLAMAGLAANLAAMAMKLAEKSVFGTGWEGGPVAVWWPKAVVTYSVCGLLAGWLSAVVWFRFASPCSSSDASSSAT